MKKLLTAACALMLLTGCGSDTKKETKTCSMEMAGVEMSIKMDAEDDIIQKINMDLTVSGTLIGGDASILSDEELNTTGNVMLSSLRIEEGEGISSKFSIDGKDLKAVVDFDLSKADADVLEALGIIGNKDNIKLSETVAEVEKSGASCE